ncbi:ribonuclease mrp protein subunit rmp1 protein [Diplodia corticola]|uniref:Ribonuclease mrp protein subunit rmp1 protein n=1 Tax=Diplodia corticola TaxID=236234 RepID=A0A1J9QPC9_9PEZI|nr:ribonuclease mrp protein subunit rmp1 protein [Diplodia corticola]OJD29906.1 ribonuclease mrp protein subunit rmp1 protein [Diplodia corticola]
MDAHVKPSPRLCKNILIRAMAATAPPRLKPHEHADLTTFCDILHLVHHRNLNQHRHSIWWRSFSVFRRELSHFVAEYNTYQPPAATDLTPPAPKPSAKASRLAARRAAARLDAWRRHHVPRWYLAFADVIASTQFSALGLALLAVLARVTQVTGITAAYEDEAEQAMQAALRELAAMDAKRLVGAIQANEGASLEGDGVAAEDLGEAVGRREDLGEVVGRDTDGEKGDDATAVGPGLQMKRGMKGDVMELPSSKPIVVLDAMRKKKKEKRTAEPEPEPEPEPEAKGPPKKKKKTKKSKASAIDDLFAGL